MIEEKPVSDQSFSSIRRLDVSLTVYVEGKRDAVVEETEVEAEVGRCGLLPEEVAVGEHGVEQTGLAAVVVACGILALGVGEREVVVAGLTPSCRES